MYYIRYFYVFQLITRMHFLYSHLQLLALHFLNAGPRGYRHNYLRGNQLITYLIN